MPEPPEGAAVSVVAVLMQIVEGLAPSETVGREFTVTALSAVAVPQVLVAVALTVKLLLTLLTTPVEELMDAPQDNIL